MLTFVTISLSFAKTLPELDGYLRFQTSMDRWGYVEYYYPMAPDPSAHGHKYTSTRKITSSSVLTAICDTYDDACGFHNGENGATGKFVYNSTANTYVKKAIGVVVDGSTPTSKYFKMDTNPPRNIYCMPYVGWALPVDLIKSYCNNDTTCDGFIMEVDNSYGRLCKFSGPEIGTDCQPHFKLA